jgi:vesicle-fusing ATPase
VLNDTDSKQGDVTTAPFGIFSADAKRPPKMVFQVTPSRFMAWTESKKKSSITLGPNFLKTMGIGGLDQEFENILRRAFTSRLYPAEFIARRGIKHCKGLLLYGPPGTGKTLIARQIGKILDWRDPVVINGPEVLSKFVGQTEENLRKAFEPAQIEQKEKGNDSDLHIIIFDELDAICKQRGSTGGGAGGAVHDSAVNTLLTMIDGVNELNNILVIGMTNRKDLIDSALLRPGRLEIHMEIGLPDENGRLQIFNIHTAALAREGALADDVDLATLAREAKNYSGAEIEGIVRAANSNPLFNGLDTSTGGAGVREDLDFNSVEMQVTMDDFRRAMEELPAAFGADSGELEDCLQRGFVNWSTHGGSHKVHRESMRLVNALKQSATQSLVSLLLEGPHGAGKTAIAAKIALDSKFPYTRLIRPEDYVGLGEGGKISKLTKVFEDAHRSPLSMIVLDNIERMIEYVPIGPRFSNPLLQALLVLLKMRPPPLSDGTPRKLMVIGTTSAYRIFAGFDLKQAFDSGGIKNVPRLSSAEHVITAIENMEGTDVKISEADKTRIATNCPFPITIKQFLSALEVARLRGDDGTSLPDRFMESCEEMGLTGGTNDDLDEF